MSTAAEIARSQRQTCAAVIELIAGLIEAPASESTIEQLCSAQGELLFDAIAEEFDCAAEIDSLSQALSTGPAPALALDIAVAWTRLFDSVMGMPAVPLYESAYAGTSTNTDTAPATRLFGHAVDEMNELLVRFDVSVDGSSEPADHVSVELALYAVLLRRGDADGIALMRERLGRWVPALVDLCRSNDPGGFHGAIASLLGVLLKHAPALHPHEEGNHHAA
ncbi:molecular chaperone [Cupriavidus pauculus]|uniref:TorD/DmsD family molecular chaperone n=1 Tax=Cupriavidus pauculus TaxID=82633 RepID=UPI001EE1ABAC|nr:molecular chaperone TorD family protein [Cupriavidus pauculus]GJG93027.1 hypothetical protein CBA19C6_01080 [Cupriavidus pauculus]